MPPALADDGPVPATDAQDMSEAAEAAAVLVDRPEEPVLRATLNRPEAMNALSMPMREALADFARRVDTETGIRVGIITGGPTVFAAGADIKAMVDARPMVLHRRGIHRLWQAIAECRKPLIAAVNGYALGGGCELAMHCDLIVAGTGARFGLPEVKVGIMPGAGGTQRLIRAVGKHRALRLLLTGEPIDAPTAADWGLVTDLVHDDAVMETALSLAGTIARRSPLAVEHIKEVALAGADLPLSAGLMLERKSMHLLFDTADQTEGMTAFLDRRRPDFRGE